MTSTAIQAQVYGVPAGTPLVLYTCLPAPLGAAANSTVDAARRSAKDAHCEIAAEFIDRADPLGDRNGCPGRHHALAGIESGTARGIITPLMAMLARGKTEHLAACQQRTGAYLLTSSAIDTPEANGILPRCR